MNKGSYSYTKNQKGSMARRSKISKLKIAEVVLNFEGDIWNLTILKHLPFILLYFPLIGFGQNKTATQYSVFSDSGLVEGIYFTLEEVYSNTPSITNLDFRMELTYDRKYDLQINYNGQGKNKYETSKEPYFGVYYKDNFYIKRNPSAYLKAEFMGPYIGLLKAYSGGGGGYMAGGVGGDIFYGGGQSIDQVEVYDCKKKKFLVFITKVDMQLFLKNYPKLWEEFKVLKRKQRKDVNVILGYVKSVNDILLEKSSEEENLSKYGTGLNKLEPGVLPNVFKDSFHPVGLYETALDFLNNTPKRAALKPEQNYGGSYSLSIYVEDAKEYKIGCNHYFGFKYQDNFYLNPNYGQDGVSGKYYKVQFIGPISYVTTLTTYREGTFITVFDYRIQEFIKIINPKHMLSLLREDPTLVNEYVELKGREKNNIEIQLEFIKRLNKKLLAL